MMKELKYFVFTLILMLGISSVVYSQDKKDIKSNKETIVFDVSMTCENCQNRIEKSIAFENGVTDMKVDLPNKTVQIEFKKDKTSVEKLQAAIEKLGYEVKVNDSKQKK